MRRIIFIYDFPLGFLASIALPWRPVRHFSNQNVFWSNESFAILGLRFKACKNFLVSANPILCRLYYSYIFLLRCLLLTNLSPKRLLLYSSTSNCMITFEIELSLTLKSDSVVISKAFRFWVPRYGAKKDPVGPWPPVEKIWLPPGPSFFGDKKI